MLATLLPAGRAQAAPEITWYYFDVPPQYITAGPQKEKGFLDLALRNHIIAAMPQYRHKLVEAPFQRLELMLKSDPNTCVMGLFRKPEREQFMWFSRPFLAQFPPGILVRQSAREKVAPYLNERGKLSLRRLLEAGELKIGVGGTRSYGAVIDGLLKPHLGEANIYINSAANAASGLVQMAAIGRVDAVPGFPYEAQYLGMDVAKGGSALAYYPLAEQPDYLLGHAACAKSEFGKQVVKDIDDLLQQASVRNAIADYYASWLDDGTRKLEKELRKYTASPAASSPSPPP
nr:TIGR02285 family protein [Pseudoduganella ginsengisoli]